MLGIGKEKQKDLSLILGYFGFAAILALFLKLPYLFMSIIYMGVPSIFLAVKLRKYVHKLFFETFFFSIVVVTVVNYIATFSNSWVESTIFPFKVLDMIPVETYIWAIIYVFLNISFYSYFYDRYKLIRLSRKSKRGIALLIAFTLLFVTLLAIDRELLKVKYFYALLSCVFLIVSIVGAKRQPQLYRKFILTELLLFVPWMLHELVSLQLGHWYFISDQYLGYITLGRHVLPYEEIFWLIIVTPVLLLLHEYFADDLKNTQTRTEKTPGSFGFVGA